jgi:hypothetical protein
MSKTDRTHIRHNLSFDMQDDQQRIAHEYLLKLDRGQSKKIAELICNMLSQNGIKNVATLSAEKAEKLSTLFFKLDDEKQKEAYEYLSILGERQFEKIADLVAELLSRNGVNDISNLTADEAYALEIMPLAKILEAAMDCAVQRVLAQNPSPGEGEDRKTCPQYSCEPVKPPVETKESAETITEKQLEKVEEPYYDDDVDDDDLDDDDLDDDSGINMDLFKSFG